MKVLHKTTNGYGSATMWLSLNVGSTKVHSKGVLSSTELPEVPTASYYSSTVVSSVVGVDNYVSIQHRIENPHILSGKTATLSFYAKANTNRKMGLDLLRWVGVVC